MSRTSKLRDVIIEALITHGPMTTRQICDIVYGEPKKSSDDVKKCIAYLVATDVISTDGGVRGHHVYTLMAKGYSRCTIVPANNFTVPPEMRGRVLTPMAWSMAYLLGASC